MNYLEELSNYQPTCEQEKQDYWQINQYLTFFDNLLERKNSIAHFTSSSLIVNPERTKTLMIYHKQYQSWSWTGGHVDGNPNFLEVAVKEAKEETGLKQLTIVSKDIASLDILAVNGHVKQNKWVSAHQHLSVAYILEADEQAELQVNQIETNGVKWVPLDSLAEVSQEAMMLPIYQKLILASQK